MLSYFEKKRERELLEALICQMGKKKSSQRKYELPECTLQYNSQPLTPKRRASLTTSKELYFLIRSIEVAVSLLIRTWPQAILKGLELRAWHTQLWHPMVEILWHLMQHQVTPTEPGSPHCVPGDTMDRAVHYTISCATSLLNYVLDMTWHKFQSYTGVAMQQDFSHCVELSPQ